MSVTLLRRIGLLCLFVSGTTGCPAGTPGYQSGSGSTLVPPMAKQAFPGRLEMSPFGDGEHWFLLRPFEYRPHPDRSSITMPAGFVTDLASVPSVAESAVSRWGLHGPAAVVHDFLYWEQRCTQEQADRLMLRAMRQMGVPAEHRSVIAQALELGGPGAWNGNTQLHESDFVRIIPPGHFPGGGLTVWEDLREELWRNGVRPAAVDEDAPSRELSTNDEKTSSKDRESLRSCLPLLAPPDRTTSTSSEN